MRHALWIISSKGWSLEAYRLAIAMNATVVVNAIAAVNVMVVVSVMAKQCEKTLENFIVFDD